MIRAQYIMNNDYEASVANALPNAGNVNAVLTRVANKVIASAKTNIEMAPKTDINKAKNVQAVVDGLTLKPAKEFRRGRKRPTQFSSGLTGTRIPIVLVVSNAWQSKWYEFGKGSGASFPATRFMRRAAMAAKAPGIVFTGRGRSRKGGK